jgi:hypothetical protein
MREGFRALAEGWLIIDDCNALAERIERLADFVMVHGGPLEMQPDEKALIIEMLRQQLVLSCRVFGLGVPSL